MAKTFATEFAVCSDGRCDLTGLPCLRALNLARQMARASASLGDTLLETFGLEAEVDISGCLRPCRLSLAVAEARVAVSREGQPLASAQLPDMSMGLARAEVSPAMAAIGWRAH
jgi:hypothetical protein